MTQAVPETKTPTENRDAQVPQNVIEKNFANAPSIGHEEGIPNSTAELAVAETIEEQTGDVNAGEQEILEDPSIRAEPSADHATIQVHSEVQEANVQVVTPESQAEVVSQDARNLGVNIVGETAETHTLGQTQGVFNPPQEIDHTSTRVFPPVLKTNKYADKKNNGAPLQALWKKRLESLLYGIKPKILGGTKTAPEVASAQDNISQLPQPREIKKAA